jgi:glycosyltransferase involved in cell wall biosynthesis
MREERVNPNLMLEKAMRPTVPISCFIIAKDEAARIGRAISSVRGWVDEVVVVVDTRSTDDTQGVARRLGARVVESAWAGYGPQKRFAEDLCRNPWLLNLDADEAITPALAEEIRGLFVSGQPAADGYRIFIIELLSFQEEPDRWGHGLWQIRLYDRRKGRFSESPVHDAVQLAADTQAVNLTHRIEHRSNTSLSFAINKFNRYTDAQVAELRVRGRKLSRLRLLSEFPLAFLKAYFVRRYFLRGLWGWTSAIDFAYFRHQRIAKAYEAGLLGKAGKIRDVRLQTSSAKSEFSA